MKITHVVILRDDICPRNGETKLECAISHAKAEFKVYCPDAIIYSAGISEIRPNEGKVVVLLRWDDV